jgi:hypothetical protein
MNRFAIRKGRKLFWANFENLLAVSLYIISFAYSYLSASAVIVLSFEGRD